MGSNQRQTTITLEQITMIAEALSAWQQTWLCRNPDLTHMTDEEVTRARMRAAERARPALELLTELHSEFFRVPIHPAPAVPGAEEVEAIRARHEAWNRASECNDATKQAHTDRATLLRLLDAERAELDKEQVSHLKTRAKLTEIRNAAALLVRTWQERNPMRAADFHPPPCDCYRCLYDALAAALKEPK